MSVKNPYREALEAELERWDGVYHEYDASGTKHDKVRLFSEKGMQFYTLSRGAKGGRGTGRRAGLNMRADLRRVLRDIGGVEKA